LQNIKKLSTALRKPNHKLTISFKKNIKLNPGTSLIKVKLNVGKNSHRLLIPELTQQRSGTKLELSKDGNTS